MHDQRAFRVSLTLSAADARGGAAVPQCPIVYAGWVEEINQEGKTEPELGPRTDTGLETGSWLKCYVVLSPLTFTRHTRAEAIA